MKYQIIFITLLSYLLTVPCIAQTDPFFLGTNAVIPTPFLEKSQTGVFFKNQAHTALSSSQKFSVSTVQDFYGYNLFSASYLLPIRKVTFGFGYQSLSATDIPKTERSGSRPTIESYIGHYCDLYKFSIAIPFGKAFKLSGSMNQETQKLDTNIQYYYYGDLAAVYTLNPKLSIGVFSKHLVSIQDFSKLWGMDLYWNSDSYYIGYLFDNPNHEILGGIELFPSLSIDSHVMWNKPNNMLILAIGPTLKLNAYDIQYLYTQYFGDTLGQTMQLLSIQIKI